MTLLKKLAMRLAITVAIVVCTATTVKAVDARDPLTFANVGLYCGWNDYIISRESPFDFLIIQANVIDGKVQTGRWHQRGADFTWNDFLKEARANGKRVIAVVNPIFTNKSGDLQLFSHLHSQGEEAAEYTLERYVALFDDFFAQVDEEELYAISITEENVFWNGQLESLEHAYDYIKGKYNIPVYQWYSPSQSGATPGLTWPNIKSDGWMVDEYFLQRPTIEAAMRMYTILRKPAMQIVWAAPDMPSVPWSDRTFWDQFEVCRKYNVPIAFFCWNGQDDSPASDSWSWFANASDSMRQVYEDYCLYAVHLAKTLPPVSTSEWEMMPTAQKQVILTIDAENPKRAFYQDRFDKRREFALWNDVSLSGFEHLKWDTSPLQLKPRRSGDARATMRYCFHRPEKLKQLIVSIDGMTDKGTVRLQIADRNDKVIAESIMSDGTAKVTIDSLQLAGPLFWVTIVMEGSADQAEQVLAEYSAISVEAELLIE